MSTLYEKATSILVEKEDKILPTNIRKDIKIFNVDGILENKVKLFNTIEQMHQDSAIQENDLALVFREEAKPVTEDIEFDTCLFPMQVRLSEAFSGTASCSFEAVDSGSYASLYANLSTTECRCSYYGDTTSIDITYTSEDGIIYTRTDTKAIVQELGTKLKYRNFSGEPLNSVFGNFIQVRSNSFDGLLLIVLIYNFELKMIGFTF